MTATQPGTTARGCRCLLHHRCRATRPNGAARARSRGCDDQLRDRRPACSGQPRVPTSTPTARRDRVAVRRAGAAPARLAIRDAPATRRCVLVCAPRWTRTSASAKSCGATRRAAIVTAAFASSSLTAGPADDRLARTTRDRCAARPAGEFVTRTPHTESDPTALLAQFLVAFGAAAGRDVHYAVEVNRHHPTSS